MSLPRCNVTRLLGSLALGLSATMAAMAADAGDTIPCKIQQRSRIVFPYRALVDGVIHGEAVLMLDVDRMGQLTDVLVIAYTRPEFADAATDAVHQWRFTPAQIGGEPVGSTITLNAKFEVNGVLAYVKPLGVSEPEPRMDERYEYHAYALEALDRVPAALQRPGPLYLKEWIKDGRRGAVTVEFFIDEKGRVRFPRVLNQADDYLGAAALDAVRQWRFAPPLRKGRPVLARVSQVFNFEPETQPAAR